MLLIDVVHEIFALEDAVSFNFALGAPHVKRRVKSRRPASAAPDLGDILYLCLYDSYVLYPPPSVFVSEMDITICAPISASNKA